MNIKILGSSMSILERAYYNSDMGYWFEDAPEAFEEEGGNPDKFEEQYPKFLAKQYRKLFKEHGIQAIDEILMTLLDGPELLETILRDTSNTEIIDAVIAMEQCITPECKSYDLLQEYMQQLKTLPLHNMQLTMEVMSQYMFHVTGFGPQSNSFGTIGRLTGDAFEPEEYSEYQIRATISPKPSSSRSVAILFKFDVENKLRIDFKIAHDMYLNKNETVIGLGKLIKALTTKEFSFSGNDARDKENLDNLVCKTLEEYKPAFDEYLKENPDDSPLPCTA